MDKWILSSLQTLIQAGSERARRVLRVACCMAHFASHEHMLARACTERAQGDGSVPLVHRHPPLAEVRGPAFQVLSRLLAPLSCSLILILCVHVFPPSLHVLPLGGTYASTKAGSWATWGPSRRSIPSPPCSRCATPMLAGQLVLLDGMVPRGLWRIRADVRWVGAVRVLSPDGSLHPLPRREYVRDLIGAQTRSCFRNFAGACNMIA